MKRKLLIIVLVLLILTSFYTYKVYKVITIDYKKTVLLGGNSIGIKANTDSINDNQNNIQVNYGDFSAGTLTYVDITDNSFGALGHEYSSDNTNGNIYDSYVLSSIKSTNTIGYKLVAVDENIILGNYNKDTKIGIFGSYNSNNLTNNIEIAMPKEIKTGKAYIVTSLYDNKIEYFEINITFKNYLSNKTNIYFTIIDEKLLNETNGLISGMSGSPIIQNGKLIGAVSSANKNNFKKGYGVFITSMINNEKPMN